MCLPGREFGEIHADAAAGTGGDRQGEAWVLDQLGIGQELTGNYPAAAAVLTRALELFGDLGDRRGQAWVLIQLGIVQWQQACEALAARRLTPYSLIAAGQKFFLSTLTLGFETDLDKTIDTTATGWRARKSRFPSVSIPIRAR